MSNIDSIFSITDDDAFRLAALDTFRRQAASCEVYRDYIAEIGVDVQEVDTVAKIPHLPIEFFKWRDVYCGDGKPEVVFTSSNTGATTASRHAMQSLANYELAFGTAFRRFYGEPSRWSIYGLLPSYLERTGSSLIYMVDKLIEECGSGGFYLHNYEKLLDDMRHDPKPKILLGVSYALWELAEQYPQPLDNTIVMETGGMKGHREELPKAEFHRILCQAFRVEKIHSEYGMAELTSQAYSSGEGIFRSPEWMRISLRDINDPFTTLPVGSRGGINIIDLANSSSCAFIQTQDVGRTFADGSFVVEGRITGSDIRGCNLLIQ